MPPIRSTQGDGEPRDEIVPATPRVFDALRRAGWVVPASARKRRSASHDRDDDTATKKSRRSPNR